MVWVFTALGKSEASQCDDPAGRLRALRLTGSPSQALVDLGTCRCGSSQVTGFLGASDWPTSTSYPVSQVATRTRLSSTTTITTAHATTRSTPLIRHAPITSSRLLSQTRGATAKPIPKLSTT